MIEIFASATHNNTTGKGGWGTVVLKEDGKTERYNGCEAGATQNAMVLKAAIEGLSKTPTDCEVKICSNNEYLVLGIDDSRQRNKNRELWEQLDDLRSRRSVRAEHTVPGKWLKEAQSLAREAAGV